MRKPIVAHTPECFRSHMGFWLIEPGFLAQAMVAIRAGAFKESKPPRTLLASVGTGTAVMDPLSDPDYPEALYMISPDGVAVVEMTGAMAKAAGKYAQVGTVQVRRALRHASGNAEVRAIMLTIDSPGGTTSGTQQLADEVRAADAVKPTYAHIEDMGASAAYWAASQARRVTANTGAMVGSLGTYAVVEDTSEQAALEGVKVHVLSTGPFKGAFTEGAPVTEAQLADYQALVDSINGLFMSGVAGGRRMSMADAAKLFDGRVHMATQAQALGLVDAVQSFDQTLAMIVSELPRPNAPSNQRSLDLARARR